MPINHAPQATPVPAQCWFTASQLQPSPSAQVHDWLFVNQDSLTQRLIALSANNFSVTPISEGWQPMRSDECAALNVADGSQGWVREVYLRGHGQPWVFARSVSARSALEGSGLELAQLGTRSLGELLFSDQAFDRGELQACHYPAACLPADVQAEHLWARRSCFSRGKLAILVAEVFLPAFWAATQIER
ncbi:chorismate--pyruvate lyase family protein [Pseudomonas sp. NPDC078700]|uniref:chorismate--pyruvate lyase family protein n=1 Tax=Pseudomonas sp. NPDC078700 TaxID=3364424 RepID=UPI0037C54232